MRGAGSLHRGSWAGGGRRQDLGSGVGAVPWKKIIYTTYYTQYIPVCMCICLSLCRHVCEREMENKKCLYVVYVAEFGKTNPWLNAIFVEIGIGKAAAGNAERKSGRSCPARKEGG